MSDSEPKLKYDTKKTKIENKQREKAVRAGKDDSDDDNAEKLFEAVEGGEAIFDLGNKRKRVSVGEFKGKVNINFREYFQKDSEWLPTKKGITMTTEQWELFKKLIPKIDTAINKLSK